MLLSTYYIIFHYWSLMQSVWMPYERMHAKWTKRYTHVLKKHIFFFYPEVLGLYVAHI